MNLKYYAGTALASFFILGGFFLAGEINYWVPITPMVRGFDSADVSLAYTKKPDTVGDWTYVGICLTIPPILVAFFEAAFWYQNRKHLRHHHWGVAAYIAAGDLWILFFIGLGVTVSMTNLLKYVIARPRPYFLQACKPNYTAIGCDESLCVRYPYCPHCGLVDFEKFGNICTDPKHQELEDNIWFSFPSLHASHTTFAMAYFIFYLQFRVMKVRHARTYFTAVAAVFQYAAFAFAIYTSSTRVADNRHHWEDVLFGMFLGTIAAIWSIHGSIEAIKTHAKEHLKIESKQDSLEY